MDTADLDALVDDLSSNIDDLEQSLAPLLRSGLMQSTSKLPLLDKAKAYVFTTYAIESMLISYLRLSGVDGKSHPIFQEMARVREYNGKIKAAETGGAKRGTALDREAANRMIKHGLSGNDRYDQERAQRVAAEKAGAKRKLEDMSVGTHTRFDGAAKRMKANEEVQRTVGERTPDLGNGDEENTATASSLDSKNAKREKNKHHERELESPASQSRSVDRCGGAGEDGLDHAEDEGAAQQTGKASGATSTAQTSPGGNHGALKKKKKSRRKKKAEKMENARAEEMM